MRLEMGLQKFKRLYREGAKAQWDAMHGETLRLRVFAVKQACLFAQVHTPVLIQLPEIRIAEVFDKPYRFTC